ncbi:HAD family hydrolase [Cohnella sp. LGH]|uniref:HAD family hydrolase n=1 Tax=Cohnella sp. LGH TaxID=1619153 RepID=UPI001AD9A0AD|nr:HAD family hydrolase [Cohnella sp. LGH]QTH45794.1 HAD family hydrolase [Cohnella sp. LGH]
MYKAIIFDLDNTLLDYSFSELDAMKRTLADHRLFVDEEEQWEAFWTIFSQHNLRHWMDFVNNRGPHRSIQDVLISSFRDSLEADASQHERLTASYWDYFCNTCYFENGARDVLDFARARYKLGIISNGIGEAQRLRLAAGEIFNLFHSVVVSDEVGIRKPRKEIFEYALEELRLAPRDVLFVGDSLTDDYEGARNAGIDFCFYNRGKKELVDSHSPKYVIREMRELLECL